jgi:hypothetical protein
MLPGILAIELGHPSVVRSPSDTTFTTPRQSVIIALAAVAPMGSSMPTLSVAAMATPIGSTAEPGHEGGKNTPVPAPLARLSPLQSGYNRGIPPGTPLTRDDAVSAPRSAGVGGDDLAGRSRPVGVTTAGGLAGAWRHPRGAGREPLVGTRCRAVAGRPA